MSRYRFRLERVLHAKRAAEQLQRAQLAAAEHGARRSEQTARSCTDAVLAARADLRAEQSADALDPARILVSQDAHERMSVVEQSLHAQAELARQAATTERTVWRALRVDVRGMERLDARGRERKRERTASHEDRAIEEFAARQAEQRRLDRARR